MSPAARLVDRVPRVHVGPDAARALEGVSGLLLGVKRPEWVDVLCLEEYAGVSRRRLVELRFDASPLWEIVGVSLPEAQFRRHRSRLVEELVPGDVVLTQRGAFIHLGDRFAAAPFAKPPSPRLRRREAQ